MGVSQILFIYISSLINIVFNIINMKNMKTNTCQKSSMRKHVNINKELEIVTKINRANL